MISSHFVKKIHTIFLVSMTIVRHHISRTDALSTNGIDPHNNKLKQVKGVLFDIDGTLADSWKLGFDATQAVLSNNNIELISEHTYHECTRYTTPHRLALHAGLEEGTEEFRIKGNELAEEFDELYVDLVDTKTAGLYTGIKELLTEHIPEDVKVGALTNACVAYAHAVLRENNISYRFSTVHGADDVPAAKPKGDGLLLCCKEIGLDPSECVYIGDSPSDGFAAADAGMPFLGVLWGSHSKESLSKAPNEYLCSNVQELQIRLPSKSSNSLVQ